MEDAKLVALYNTLKGGFKGKGAGLGLGGRARKATGGADDGHPPLPDNPLYAHFVRAGGYRHDEDDTIAPEFTGKRMKLGSEDDDDDDSGDDAAPAPAAASKGSKSKAAAPADSSDSENEADAAAARAAARPSCARRLAVRR